MNHTIEDATLFSIRYSNDGLNLYMDIDTTGTSEYPNYILNCGGVIMSSIQNCFHIVCDGELPPIDDGLPIYIGIIEVTPIPSEIVLNQLRNFGFSLKFECEPKFATCYSVRIETGDFLAKVICRESKFTRIERPA